MKKWMMAAATVAAMTSMLSAPVDAARLGGGRSFGKQSPSIMQRSATPTPPAAPSAAPASPALRQPAAGATTAAAAQQAGRSRWMAPLAGIAAGLGLAWLAHSLGFGDGLATVLLIVLAGVAVLALVRMLRARGAPRGAQPAFAGQRVGSAPADGPAMARQSYALSAAGASSGGFQSAAAATGGAFQPAAAQAAAVAVAAGPQVPAGFDTEGFLRNAKSQFIRLQAAYDAAALDDLREFTSPQMFEQVSADIVQRGVAPNRTDVMNLDAELLGIETDAVEHTASVRFSGTIREGAEAPTPFDEVWNLTRPVSGPGGWVLAGIQQVA